MSEIRPIKSIGTNLESQFSKHTDDERTFACQGLALHLR